MKLLGQAYPGFPSGLQTTPLKYILVAEFKTAKVRKNTTLGTYANLSSKFFVFCLQNTHMFLWKKKPHRESMSKFTIPL